MLHCNERCVVPGSGSCSLGMRAGIARFRGTTWPVEKVSFIFPSTWKLEANEQLPWIKRTSEPVLEALIIVSLGKVDDEIHQSHSVDSVMESCRGISASYSVLS